MAYNGRRAPNVSKYLRDLNSATTEAPADDSNDFETNLALFTNTQFFDFDSGHTTDYRARPQKASIDASASTASADDMNSAGSVIDDLSGMEFLNCKHNLSLLSLFLCLGPSQANIPLYLRRQSTPRSGVVSPNPGRKR